MPRNPKIKHSYQTLPSSDCDGVEIVIRNEFDEGVEVQTLRSYGVGIDCHSKFIAVIESKSNPVPDMSKPLHYVIEVTSTYHMPILMAWEGIPSVINPMLAGATKKKTGELDAQRLSFHDLTGVWDESYVASNDIQELRVLIAERNHFQKLATQCSNRINNIRVMSSP